MTHRRIVRTFVVLAGSIVLADGGYAVAARQAAPPTPTSEQMGKVSLGETKRVYGPGSVIMVSEGTTHANENAGPETLVYVEVNITGTVPGPARAGTPPTK